MPSTKRTPLQVSVRKRAEHYASIEVRRRQIATLEARIAALDATIADLGGLPKPRPLRIPYRCGGLMQRTCFDLFRERETITSADVAQRIAAHYKADWSDPFIRKVFVARAVQCLNKLRTKGLVRKVGHTPFDRKGNRFGLWARVS